MVDHQLPGAGHSGVPGDGDHDVDGDVNGHNVGHSSGLALHGPQNTFASLVGTVKHTLPLRWEQ